MKRSARIICALFVIIMLASALVVSSGASSAYQTYTYSIAGYALYSPDAYTADANIITYRQMGLSTDLNNPSDMVTDDKGNVYIADSGNNRIVCLDRYYKQKFIINGFVNDKGVKDSLLTPQGVFITKNNIWVCDTGK